MSTALKKPDSQRDIDPNVRQRMASNPDGSVWVNASAGSGKTKVLTDRVLRLLLPRDDGRPGTPPHKILCLTFTKAGASEMALRIQKTLGEWAVMDEEKLIDKLQNLLGRTPEKDDILAARRLFADVIDTPGGLKIMTIHSFCQSTLGRFPLEAGVSPTFTVLEESQAATLLSQARDRVLTRAHSDKSHPLYQALQSVAAVINEQQFFSLIKNIVSERRQLADLLRAQFSIEGLYTALCNELDVQPGLTPEDILTQACAEGSFERSALQFAAEALSEQGTKTDQSRADILFQWLAMGAQDRPNFFESYQSVYFTQSGGLRAKLAGAKVDESAHETLAREAARIQAVQNTINAAQCAALTRGLMLLGQTISDEYDAVKAAQAALDFDDLIFKTEDLLKQEGGASWVLYKLDQGLEHILIDEAQDTNPEQWRIIEALCTEFFTGQGQSDEARTAFTVGDEKQSIYSFQRASPEEFHRMHIETKNAAEHTEQTWNDVDLNISFRSTPAVLEAVDAVFKNSALRQGLSEHEIEHISYRRRQAGLVELWPVFETAKKEENNPWAPPVTITENSSSASMLAQHIAKSVAGWIENEAILPSHDRPIHAGDIMILVRTRTAFVNQLVKALKTHNVPVSGVDRMILSKQLIIEDLMALISFALLPTDDLTLACVLKSPLIGLSEEQLYDLAVDRPQTLWASLLKSGHSDVIDYLRDLAAQAAHAHPYEFLTYILYKPCPADEISGLRAIKTRLGEDALDPIDELLNAALNFERSEISALQNFLQWHLDEETQVKRELGDHAQQLRIMTVHGSKGLQAPIVILPDTLRITRQSPTQSDSRLLWPNKTGLPVPLWSPRNMFDTPVYKEAKDQLLERLEEEYRRLLYVAMTRAEDRLYIAGHAGPRAPLEESWYHYIKSGLESLPETQTLDDGTLQLTNPQNGDPDRNSTQKKQTGRFAKPPQCLYIKAPDEPHPPAPLIPSRPSEADQTPLSPLKSRDNGRFKRGNLTHKLLEILPEMPLEKREKAACKFIDAYGHDLPEDARRSIVDETLVILNDPQFSPIFGPGSFAEVPVSGLLSDKRLVSGQIDRLYVTDETIWIIDYKTNRPAPQDPANIPQIYINQMQSYADVLREIYKGRTLHAALLWTDGPYLMAVPIK